jgi:ribonuclease HII
LPTFDLELELQRQGFSLVAGVDEVGRGPLAGPVVAAAVVLPPEDPGSDWLLLVDDSKALTPLRRRKALNHIEARATAIGLGMATHREIDFQGIGNATRSAMLRAVDNLRSQRDADEVIRPSHLLIDFVKLPECGIPFLAMARGDSLSYSIAAASIVAKVTRDRLMEEAEAMYPGYGFSQHKGYPTPHHLRRLGLLGPSPIHRHSFSPLRGKVS